MVDIGNFSVRRNKTPPVVESICLEEFWWDDKSSLMIDKTESTVSSIDELRGGDSVREEARIAK
jgi:hypothetical protein